MFSPWFPRAKPHLAPRSGRPNAVATAESGADGVGGEGWAAGEVFNKCGSQGDQGHPIDNGWDLWCVTPKKINWDIPYITIISYITSCSIVLLFYAGAKGGRSSDNTCGLNQLH